MHASAEMEQHGAWGVGWENVEDAVARLREGGIGLTVTKPPGSAAWTTLSQAPLDGTLFAREKTDAVIRTSLHPDQPVRYYLSSTIFLSETEQQTPGRGYYAPERIGAVIHHLRAGGMTEKIAADEGVISTLTIRGFPGMLYADFGYAGRWQALGWWELYNRAAKSPAVSAAIIGVLRQSNREITVQLQEGTGWSPAVRNDDIMRLQLQWYARTYGRLLRALYAERSLPIPDEPVILRTPRSWDVFSFGE